MKRIASAATSAAILVGSWTFAAPASAATVVEHGTEVQVDVNPDSENPCNGQLGELIDDERDSWTVATRADGSYLARGHAVVAITFTPYGEGPVYSGSEIFSSTEHVGRGADGFRTSHRVRLTGDDGSSLVFVEYAHVVMGPSGSIRVERESSTLACG